MRKINIQEIDTDKILNQYLIASDPKDEAINMITVDLQFELMMIDDDSTLNESEKEESRKLSENRHKNELTEIQSGIRKFWIPPTTFEKKMIEWNISHVFEMNKDKIEHAIKSIPLSRKSILSKGLDDLFTYSFEDLEGIHEDIIKGYYVQDFNKLANYIGLIRFAQYLNEEIKKEDETVIPESEKPIKWIGKPSQLGYIMGQLAICGYIDAPQKKDGEINYSEFARQLSKVFSVNSIENLAKELNPEKNSLENNNREKIQIPHIKSIS